MTIHIRKGTKQDIDAALELIHELAHFELAPGEVEVSAVQMVEWGFGTDKIFDFFVAEWDGRVVGMALYYYKYSTWKGKCLFLEDIIVTANHRRAGVGRLLFNAVLDVAKTTQVKRLEWQVLNWNSNAINFYKKYGASLDEEWTNGKLVYDQIQAFTPHSI